MPGNGSQTPILDHIVILVSHRVLLELPDKLKDSFNVVIGGQHADGLTSNDLIFFQDGVYIELIAFFDDADPQRRKNHRWGQLPEGIIVDWAYTLPHESDFASVQQRVRDAGTEFAYADPTPGGRAKPDGTVLKWAVASATRDGSREAVPGRLPFWCLDRTPRELRVPYVDNPQTEHPSGARGVSRVLISVQNTDLPAISQIYGAIHGDGGSPEGKANEEWHFGVPSGSAEGKQVIQLSSGDSQSEIRLTLSGGEGEPSSVEILPGLILGFDP